MTNIREAAETGAVRTAEKAAADVHRYIDNSYDVSSNAALGAYATLALAASVDALREAVTDRLEEIANVLAELRED